MTDHAPPTPAAVPPRRIPGPRGLELWRLLGRLTDRPHERLLDLALEYGDIVELAYPLERVVLLANPEYVEHVLHHAHRNYDKQTPRWRTLRQIWGNGLLTADGDVWRRQRQRMQPAFHQDCMQHFGAMVADEAQHMAREWGASAARGDTRDVYPDMLRCAVRALTRATFGSDIEGKTDDIIAAIDDINAYTNPISLANILNVPIPVRRWITPGFGRFQRAMTVVRTVFGEIIERRIRSGIVQPDLLGMMMSARDDEAAETMTVEQLHDEMMTVLMAGHETTGIASAWSWYWISRHPEVEAALQQEVDAVAGARPPAFEDLDGLPYAKMVFQEAMRLMPPVWGYDRRAIADDSIDGYRIPAGTFVALSPFLMHHHPKYWERPEEFDPQRFLPERIARRHPYAFFPFGGGPRRCIGFRFALMEGQLLLATLARSFTVRLAPGHPVVTAPRLNLPPKFGLPMIVRPRHAPVAPTGAIATVH